MLIKFKSNSEIVVVGGDELIAWRLEHEREVPGAKFSHRYKNGYWDGLWRLGSARNSGGAYSITCGRGMLEKLLTDFPEAMVERQVPDAIYNPVPLEIDVPENLYDLQKDALSKVHTSSWGRFALATNAGKGAVAALIARAVADKGLRTIVLSDEIAVVDALRGEFETWCQRDVALVEAGRKTPPPADALITIAMVPTLARRLGDPAWTDWLASIDTALLDEADKATAETWRAVLRRLPNTTRRYGFSGTFPEPGSYHDLLIEELIGPALATVKNMELVEQEISARPTIVLDRWRNYLPRPPKDFQLLTDSQRRNWVYEEAVLRNMARHRFVASLIEKDVPNAVVVNRVEHGHALEEAIPGSVYIDGLTSKEERRTTLKAFEAGEFDVLIVTKILDRGSNRLGRVANSIFASGEGSNRQTLQRMGRLLRRTNGKESVTVHDIIDSGHYFLEKHAAKRIKLYNDEKFDIRIGR